MNVLYLVRGLPGSGKSTIARTLAAGHSDIAAIEADSFFVGANGEYNFNPKLLPEAHAWCQQAAARMLRRHHVVVANTFTQRWELEPYLRMAKDIGATVVVVDVFDAGLSDEALATRNVHGVPVQSIAAMRARWELWLEGGSDCALFVTRAGETWPVALVSPLIRARRTRR